jgi:predicted enzyme related to lactoylglutathione lyase
MKRHDRFAPARPGEPARLPALRLSRQSLVQSTLTAKLRMRTSVAQNEEALMARVTGIGGIFFKSTSDNKQLSAWYRDNLGLSLESWGGAILRWPNDKAEDRGLTVWNVAERDTKWFSPSTSSFMINYRVDDLTALLAQLKKNGVEVVKGPESAENGKFAWVMDPEGNKIELWEPMLWDAKNKT